MSRSPKYTTAYLTAEREQELARRRAAREAARRAARQAAARAKLAKRIEDQRSVLQRLERRLADLRGAATEADGRARAEQISQRLSAARAGLAEAAGLAAANKVAAVIAALDADITRYADDVAAALSQRERAGALEAIRSALEDHPRRIELDPEGDLAVRSLFRRAAGTMADQARFDAAYKELVAAVRIHLKTAAQRGEELDEAIEQAGSVLTAIGQVLDEAHSAGAALPGMPAAMAAADQLRLDMAARLPGECRRGAAVLGRAASALSTALEEWFGRLDRAQQVVEAATIALPRAGFRVDPGSLVRSGTEVSFRAVRADGTPVDVGIVPAEADSVRISYQGTGPDYMIEHTVDGMVASCDVTAQMLETFHQELGREAVATSGLCWHGKPGRDARTAIPLPVHSGQQSRRA